VPKNDVLAGNDAGERGFGCNAKTKEAPWLSLLVPVYNVQPLLADCLGSILSQIEGRQDIELVLLDDASTDGSATLCRSLIAGHESQVRLLEHRENRGLSAARNTMLDVACGEYVWFVDSDDMILPGAIDALRAILDADRPDIVLCDYVREGAVRHATFAGPKDRLVSCTRTLVEGAFVKRRLHAWSKICRRELFGATIRFPVGACFEDVATVPWLLLKARSFHYTAQPWIYYRSRPGSIMARLNKARAGFDRSSNDDMAKALLGFGRAFDAAVPDAKAAASLAVARFLSREFAKIIKRMLKGRSRGTSWRAMHDDMRRYRATMEACSPIPFVQVARQNLAGGRIGRGLELALWLMLTSPCREQSEGRLGSIPLEGA